MFQVLVLLYREVPINTPDAQGHTGLMWAAYNGFPILVEVLLQWGANIEATDDNGFTSLHWALVKGVPGCIQKLVEYGAEREAKTLDGKTPVTVAREMNSMRQWHNALADCGLTHGGSPIHFPFSFITNDRKLFVSRVFFFLPFFMLSLAFFLISSLPIYFGLTLAILSWVGIQQLANQLLKWAPANIKHVHHTVSPIGARNTSADHSALFSRHFRRRPWHCWFNMDCEDSSLDFLSRPSF